jgi:hypothetical protein
MAASKARSEARPLRASSETSCSCAPIADIRPPNAFTRVGNPILRRDVLRSQVSEIRSIKRTNIFQINFSIVITVTNDSLGFETVFDRNLLLAAARKVVLFVREVH